MKLDISGKFDSDPTMGGMTSPTNLVRTNFDSILKCEFRLNSTYKISLQG